MPTTNEDLFKPHQFTSKSPKYLYHVYDSRSQTPYIPYRGISAAKRDGGLPVSRIITRQAILDHLDWKYRGPTRFISFYSRWDDALRAANSRRSRSWYPDSVRIAEVSVEVLANQRIFFFSKRGLMRMLQVYEGDEIHLKAQRREWFVIHQVPVVAVASILVWNGTEGGWEGHSRAQYERLVRDETDSRGEVYTVHSLGAQLAGFRLV